MIIIIITPGRIHLIEREPRSLAANELESAGKSASSQRTFLRARSVLNDTKLSISTAMLIHKIFRPTKNRLNLCDVQQFIDGNYHQIQASSKVFTWSPGVQVTTTVKVKNKAQLSETVAIGLGLKYRTSQDRAQLGHVHHAPDTFNRRLYETKSS